MYNFRGVIGGRVEVQHDLRVTIFGDFQYSNTVTTPCYDNEGNFLFNHKEEVYKMEDNKSGYIDELFSSLKICDTVFQKDYKFYKIKMFNHSTREDLEKYNWSKIKGYVSFVDEYKDYEMPYIKKNPSIHEMCIEGTRKYSVYRKLGKSILDFDYNLYKKNKDEFIKHNSDCKNEVEYIFNENLNIVANFFLCDVKKLKSKSFNKREQMVKRLMFNINNRS